MQKNENQKGVEVMEYREVKPSKFLEIEPEHTTRASKKKIYDMFEYLKRRGYKLSLFKRLDKPHWKIYSNSWTWHARSNIECYNYLIPFVMEEKQKEYQEYIQKRNERERKRYESLSKLL